MKKFKFLMAVSLLVLSFFGGREVKAEETPQKLTSEEFREKEKKACDKIRNALRQEYHADLSFKFKQNALNYILYGGAEGPGYTFLVIRKDSIYYTLRNEPILNRDSCVDCKILIDDSDKTVLHCKYITIDNDVVMEYEMRNEESVVEYQYNSLEDYQKKDWSSKLFFLTVGSFDDCLLDKKE